MKPESKTELRSQKVRDLLNEIPDNLVICGKVTILIIVLGLLLVVCFVPYPHSYGESILQHLLFM
jgi:hypothetical protein